MADRPIKNQKRKKHINPTLWLVLGIVFILLAPIIAFGPQQNPGQGGFFAIVGLFFLWDSFRQKKRQRASSSDQQESSVDTKPEK